MACTMAQWLVRACFEIYCASGGGPCDSVALVSVPINDDDEADDEHRKSFRLSKKVLISASSFLNLEISRTRVLLFHNLLQQRSIVDSCWYQIISLSDREETVGCEKLAMQAEVFSGLASLNHYRHTAM